MKQRVSPCYQCENRTAECHATCEKYLTWSNNQTISKRIWNNQYNFKVVYGADAFYKGCRQSHREKNYY